MRKLKVLGGAIAVLTVGVLCLALLPATGQVGGNRFVLCERDGKWDTDKDIDNPPSDFSAGDGFLFTETEFDESGKRVGTLAGNGTVVRMFGENDALVQFNVSLNLDGGRIEIQAATRFRNINQAHFAIIGGTGKFAGKTGTVKPRDRGCDGVSHGNHGDSLVVKFD